MAKTETVLNVNSISRISAGTVIKGEIMSPNDIRIDGTFEGRIQAKGRVVIGETAMIKGDIVCDNVDLWGKVDGNVFVKDTLASSRSHRTILISSIMSTSRVLIMLLFSLLNANLDSIFIPGMNG